MKQTSLDLSSSVKKTRKREFHGEMDAVVPWAVLVQLIAPYYLGGSNGRPPFALRTMPRVHFLQQWFTLSAPAMEEAFSDVPWYGEFARLEMNGRMPGESTILRFRYRLEKHKRAEQVLATVNDLLVGNGLLPRVGTAVDATLMLASTSTENKDKARDPEMHSSKKSNQWYYGMNAHIGVDADLGLVHTVKGTAGHVHDINEGNALLHRHEQIVFADAGYRGIEKRPDVTSQVRWHVAMRPGQRKALDKNNVANALLDAAEKLKAGVRAKVEHPSRVIKRQFGYFKVRYRGLKKNIQQLITLFALSNLWMARGQLMRNSA